MRDQNGACTKPEAILVQAKNPRNALLVKVSGGVLLAAPHNETASPPVLASASLAHLS